MSICLGKAIFSSIEIKGVTRGEIIGFSPRVPEHLIPQLADWIPDRWRVVDNRRECLSCVPLDEDWMALTRTVLAGPHHLYRSCNQLVTAALVFQRADLEGFSNSVLILATVAKAMGAFSFAVRRGESIRDERIPKRTLLEPRPCLRPNFASEVEQIVRAIEIHRQVAITGMGDSLTYPEAFLHQLPFEQRNQISLSIGLRPSEEHHYDLQFFVATEMALQAELVRQQIRTITLAESIGC